MEIVALAGRIVFSIMFVMSGMNHLTKRKYMSEYAGQMGVPSPEVVVPLSGIMIIAGGLMVALGIFGDLGALLIAAFLFPTAIVMHGPWRFQDPEQRQQQQMHFMKDLTMAGASLIAFGWFVCSSGLSITGPLFG